ncbi:hypothetical protein RRG08_032163 [Elysia crispata]|uniref:CID domain-containing protein n=1 Tax=Elysia crispata TaxID=231223 RepID=A0AAE1DX29_9GAST|nr:hypothetical protein RRG08_032163 [Elysia crispata]
MSSEVADSYRSSLDDLKMNSRPQISMLTMLAEDHEQYAADIVRVIEEQIKKSFLLSRNTGWQLVTQAEIER